MTRFNPRIVLFGPPAIGKSTLVRTVHALDDDRVGRAVAIDLECVASEDRESVALQLSNWTTRGPLVVGPANLYPPKHFPWDVWRIVALIPRNEEWHLQRIDERNSKEPRKANQNELTHMRNIRDLVDQNQSNVAATIDPQDYDGDECRLLTTILDQLSSQTVS